MASSTDISCGPCAYTNQIKTATKWCTNCEEGICRQCEKVHLLTKVTKDHQMISIEDFQKIADVSISQICENHGKRLELFCKSHDQTLCIMCLPPQHATCTDVIALEEAAKKSKRSAALTILEELIEKTLENLTHCFTNRESASKSIVDQEQTIKNKIHNTRRIINEHLDKLEQNLILDLAEKTATGKSKNTKHLRLLEKTKKVFNQLNEQMSQMKKFASDLQVFLATRQITRTVYDQIEAVKTEISSARNYHLEVELHTKINTLLDNVNNFGEIKIVDSDANLSFSTNIEQAQIPIERITTVNDIQLQLKSKFKIRQAGYNMLISGCIILPNTHMLIADYSGKSQLMEYNDKGEHLRDIQVSSQPFDFTMIDTDLIAVSYGGDKYVEIINMKNNDVNKEIKFSNNCYGISYQDGRLYTVVCNESIKVTDVTGKILNTIKCDVSRVYHLTTTKDILYYTDYNTNTINCYNLNGEVIWVYKDESIVTPMGISVDTSQNVFVVGWESNNLTVIQHDGTVSKTLLTESDGLDRPYVVYYDRDSKVLFVGNRFNGNGALYNVT